MWNRIKRIFRSLFGWLIRGAEDPELILEQLRDDLRAKIPEMNRQVAEIIKHEKQLEMQLDRHADNVARLKPQVEMAVKAGPERKEAAKSLIVQLQDAQKNVAETQQALERAKERSEQMLKVRDAYRERVRQQMREATNQLSRSRQAEVEAEMAEMMGSFETGDEMDTLEQMTDVIDERLARAQARIEVAETDVEFQIAELEQETEMDQAEQTYQEYRKQLGLEPDLETADTEKTMEEIPIEQEQATPPTPPETIEEEEETQDSNWAETRRETQQE